MSTDSSSISYGILLTGILWQKSPQRSFLSSMRAPLEHYFAAIPTERWKLSPSLEFKFSPVICFGQREFHKLYTSWSLKSPLKGVCLLWLGNPGPTLLWTNTGDFAGWWGRYSQAIPTAPASNKSIISLDHSRPSPDARNLRWHQLKQPRQKELPIWNVCCFKPLSLGVICYIAQTNWHKYSERKVLMSLQCYQ